MAEGEDNADFSAAELAMIGGKRSFNRAISLAFSQAANDASLIGGTGEESRRFSDGVTDQDESEGDDDKSDWVDDDDDDDDDDDEDDGNDDDDDTDDENDDVDDLDDLENCDTVGEDISSFSKHQEISSITSSSDAPPAQSNKKKRKHRKNQLLLKKQFLCTFDNLFEAHFRSTGPEVEPKDMNVVCSVPTLMELCLQKGLKKTGISDGTKKTQIAPGIKFLLKAHKNQHKLEQVHLKWLLEALKQAEHQLKSNVHHFITQNGHKIDYFVRKGREVNLTDCSSRYSFSRASTEIGSTQVIPIGVEGFENSDWAVAALAHCINLLLPSCIHEKDSKEAKTGLLKVKRLLSNHVSTLVSHCFDIALGYVWWSRGKIDQAQKTLLDIVGCIPSDHEARLLPDKKKSIVFSCQKSLYLNELGRMMLQFEQPDSAVQYYRQAVDMFEETSVDTVDRQVMQSFVLCAAAYDQGLMDHSHAVKAASFWELVTTSPSCPVELIQASVESILHCHTGFLVANKSEQGQLHDANMRNKTWLLEADSRIEKIAARAPQVNLHHSLILSMLGDEHGAKAAYSRYVEQFDNSHEYGSFRTAVGSIALLGFEEVKPQPWWMLFKWICTRATLAGSFIRRPIPGIPLLWRKSLRHAAYSSEPSNDITEVKGRTLDLHITHDGYLSGTMLQNIPPLKSVLLDPRTGSICIPDQHRQFETLEWNNFIFGRIHYTDFCVDAFLPFPILLFQNSCEDVTVTLLNVSNTANLRNEKIMPCMAGSHPKHASVSSAVVYSKGRDTVKINLRELVMKARKTAILQHIKERCACEEDQAIIKDCNALLDYCITRGLQISFNFVERVVLDKNNEALMEIVKQKISSSSKDAKCGLRKKKVRSIDLPSRQALSLHDVFYVGRSTVILCLFTASVGNSIKMEPDTLVFLNCSSPESIRNPVIHCAILPDSVWMLPKQKTCWKSKDFKQNVFYAHTDTINLLDNVKIRKRTLVVFDEFGNIIQRKNLPHPGRPIHSWLGPYTGCFGHHIVGCNAGETTSTIRVWNTQGTTVTTKTTQVVEDLIVARDMVFVSKPPDIVVLDAITLEPLHVQTKIQGCASVTNTNGVLVRAEWRFMSILATTDCSKVSPCDGNEKIAYTRLILGVANHVLILEKQKVSSDSETNPYLVDVVADILVPGIPREAYYISKRAGLVVASSLYEDISRDPFYRENLYWFSVSGVIQGIHPMLGKSPHDFTAVPLRTKDGTTPGEDASREKCWHLFFDDGLGALCCIKLDSEDVF